MGFNWPWKIIKSFKRKRGGSSIASLELERPPAKRCRPGQISLTQPVTTRNVRKLLSMSHGRGEVEEMRRQNDDEQVRLWLGTICRPAYCVCHGPLDLCTCSNKPQWCGFDNLPLELLQLIFKEALPSEDLLDPSLYRGPNSAWCSAMVTKRSLVLVSKDWYFHTIRFLYRSIVIRRPTAIVPLLETLTATPKLGELVRSITMTSYFLPHFMTKVFYPMQQILDLCPNVKAVHDLPPFALPLRYDFPSLPPTVTSIKLSPFDYSDDILLILQRSCTVLEELWLMAEDEDRFDSRSLVFPRLRKLTLTIGGTLTEPRAALETFATRWDMPQLTELTLCAVASIDHPPLANDYRHILALHGQKLKYLAFPQIDEERAHMNEFGGLLALCPAVKHLVLPSYAVVSGRSVRPKLKQLDHWYLNTPLPADSDRLLLTFPDLDGYRRLDTALGVAIADLPHVIDPCMRGEWHLSIPGLAMSQTMGVDGVPQLELGDLIIVEDWDLTSFGTLENHAVRREQENFDFGEGAPKYVPLIMPVFDPDVGPLADYFWRWSKGRTRTEPPRYDHEAGAITIGYKWLWLADEMDDERQSDMRSENVSDLDDEFCLKPPPPPWGSLAWFASLLPQAPDPDA
ncbi:hypothetical protein C8R47DRAFT_536823 [Mycena vitilis]|nr:hypothetical protein C8R47DRAFT_536823 [Mycena vitilis]